MKDPAERPLLAGIRAELGGLAGDVRQMAAARWELARLELHADWRSAKRLMVVWAASAVMALASLPLLVVALAEMLDGCWNLSRCAWLLIFAASLAASAMLGSALAWRRFRRRLVGLEETLEELREDARWLRELGMLQDRQDA